MSRRPLRGDGNFSNDSCRVKPQRSHNVRRDVAGP